MKISHYEVQDTDRALLESANTLNLETSYNSDNLNRDNASAADAEIVTVFVNSVVDKDALDAMPNLKLLVTRSTGFDHIDVAYAKSKGVTVCNVPAYGSRTVAEFTYALMLGLTRKTYHAIEQVREKNDWDTAQFEGFNLQGKTLAIIGTGRIGLNVAQIAKGFDLKVIAYDAFPNADRAKEFGFSYAASLEEALAAADIVTLHVPANKDTFHLINQENISEFKKGSLLINTSRGDVVDPQAILEGLNGGILAGAALDVLEGEIELKEEAELMAENKLNAEKLKVLLEDHVLINHPKVIITPHIAFNTTEARREIIETTINNIQSFINNSSQNEIKI